MAIAPAAQPATAAVRIAAWSAPEAATPTIRLPVEMMPSLAPRTAARSHAVRWTKWEATGGIREVLAKRIDRAPQIPPANDEGYVVADAPIAAVTPFEAPPVSLKIRRGNSL